MKKILILVSCCFLFACGGGSSDSGGMVADTLPGSNVPANFAGVYTGTITFTASALGISETDSFPITVTVTNDAMVRFDGDDPDETFTVGLADDGSFAGNLQISEDPCTGSVGVTGSVNGTTASGDVSGSGSCTVEGVNVDVTLEGNFTASQ